MWDKDSQVDEVTSVHATARTQAVNNDRNSTSNVELNNGTFKNKATNLVPRPGQQY